MQSLRLLLALLDREARRDRPAAADRLVEQLPEPEVALVAAAAAINAGEPRRALRMLDAAPPAAAEQAAVAQALRIVAEVYDRNWFPGGGAAVFEPGDAERLAATPEPVATTRAGQVVVVLATQVLAALPTWRRFVADGPPVSTVALTQSAEALRRLRELGEPAAVAPAALAHAELRLRAGEPDADAALEAARQSYRDAQDPIGLAACELVAGDCAAAPVSSPELLGELLEDRFRPGGPSAPPDPERAERHWDAAARGFADAGAARGIAAVALRRAGLVGGAAALPLLDRAARLATDAGDGALRQLIAVHRALAAIEAGQPGDDGAVGREVGAWAADVGSRSFARGLARLALVRSRQWHEADDGRGRAAHLLAEAINEPIGAVTEAAMLRSAQAARYGVVNYRRAAYVLGMAELEVASRTVRPPLTVLEWGALVERFVAADGQAQALRDGDAIEAVIDHAGWLRGLTPHGGEFAEATALLAEIVGEVVGRGPVFIPMYRGMAARAAGDPAAGEQLLNEALSTATDPFVTVIVLGQLHRYTQAYGYLQELMAAGLPLQYAARILVRIKRYPEAVAAIEHIEGHGGFSELDQPWDAPALAAEALLGAGDPAAAAERSRVAIEAFEHHLEGLALDVFRTMATDDLTIAGMYTTAVRAHARLASSERAASGTHLARSFELSDRCRASSLGEVIELDRAVGADPAADATVRAWQQAGAQLARTIEMVGDPDREPGPPEVIQRAVRDAERTLDTASVAAHRPLAARRRVAQTPALADLQRRLAPGTLLLQFHAFDDELVGWAVTRDDARVLARDCPTVPLTAQVRRHHRALARPGEYEAERDELGRDLAKLLLTPFAAELGGPSRRVLVVPHGPLAVLPFHALPWAGDVLGAAHVVSYLPAASLLPREPSPLRIGRDAPALIVGDPAYAPDRRLRRLDGAAVEARVVAALRGTGSLTDGDADLGAVRGGLETAHLAHLATHGLLREGAPYSAELALAGTASLTVPVLSGLDTAIDLAVLSACDSGRGRATAAGDVIGLSRMLLGAGVRELIVSLWPVDDMLACLTMVALHRELLRAPAVGPALASAQRTVRRMSRADAEELYSELAAGAAPPAQVRSARDFGSPDPEWAEPSHPFYWAPFVHIGTS